MLMHYIPEVLSVEAIEDEGLAAVSKEQLAKLEAKLPADA